MIAATRKEKVSDRFAVAETAGLKPLVIDVESFAQMSADEKHAISHRGRAFRTLADGLRVVEALEAEQ